MRVNSEEYWNFRFGSGDWSAKAGFSQTEGFASSQVGRFGLGRDFRGSLCDFGCGAGDSFPIYRAAFPEAKLFGVDFSKEAIALCKSRFEALATFACGGIDAVPHCDVIVCSNVLEHLDDDVGTAAARPGRGLRQPGMERVWVATVHACLRPESPPCPDGAPLAATENADPVRVCRTLGLTAVSR